jgi:hypothetical protein
MRNVLAALSCPPRLLLIVVLIEDVHITPAIARETARLGEGTWTGSDTLMVGAVLFRVHIRG